MRLNTRQWDATFKNYMALSRRDRADVLNTKLFFIARRAVVETPKADRLAIQSVLGPVATEISHTKIRVLKNGTIKRGKTVGKAVFAKAAGREIERLALIINARRRKAGKDMLFGKAMEKEIATVWRARMRSIAFLKSGWLPAVKSLEPLAINRSGLARRDSSAKQIGRPKGYAVAARGLVRAVGKIVNEADSRHDKKGALVKYGMPALQAAFDYEIASMKEYIANKMRSSAQRLGIRTR